MLRNDRGSFPKATAPETPEEKRTRYEAWMLSTAQGEIPDPELAAILAQPNHDATGKTKFLSLARITRARCWQCVAGNEDENAIERIRHCSCTDCALHATRPYQADAVGSADATDDDAPRASRRTAINQYCRQCQGGSRTPNLAREVDACASAPCAIWLARHRTRSRAEAEVELEGGI